MTNTATRPDTAPQRKAMINSQLRVSGVNEEYVLARIMAVPREEFLPRKMASLAYIDRSVALPKGASLASPLFYGKMLIEAEPSAQDNVLIVEGGTGYLTALVEPLVGSVDTVSEDLAATGKIPSGGEGGFALVLVDGAIESLPDGLEQAIADGGRIVSGLVERGVTRLASGRKIAGQTTLQPIEDMGIPVLHSFDKPQGWTF